MAVALRGGCTGGGNISGRDRTSGATALRMAAAVTGYTGGGSSSDSESESDAPLVGDKEQKEEEMCWYKIESTQRSR